VQRVPLPAGPTRAHGAPLPRCAGHWIVADSHPRHEAGSRQPQLVKVIEPDEFISKTGYTARTTIHCGPDGSTNALGGPTGGRPRRPFLMDPDTFELKGQWEKNRARSTGVRLLVAPRYDTILTSEWGTAEHGQGRRQSGVAAGGKIRHKLHVWDLDTRRHVQQLDLGAEQQMVLDLRRPTIRRRPTGFVASWCRSRTCPHRSGCGSATAATGPSTARGRSARSLKSRRAGRPGSAAGRC